MVELNQLCANYYIVLGVRLLITSKLLLAWRRHEISLKSFVFSFHRLLSWLFQYLLSLDPFGVRTKDLSVSIFSYLSCVEILLFCLGAGRAPSPLHDPWIQVWVVRQWVSQYLVVEEQPELFPILPDSFVAFDSCEGRGPLSFSRYDRDEYSQQEFQKLKSVLTSDLLVKTFDLALNTMLLTDASGLNGLGYALIQKQKDNYLRLITCGSCSLNEIQNRYTTGELECHAIQYGISKCKFYLQGLQSFNTITDHKP